MINCYSDESNRELLPEWATNYYHLYLHTNTNSPSLLCTVNSPARRWWTRIVVSGDSRSGHYTSAGRSPPPGTGSSPPRSPARPPGSLTNGRSGWWLSDDQLTDDCHVGSLCQGEECGSDGDLTEVSAGQLGLDRVQHHPHVVRHSHLEGILLFLLPIVRSSEINDGGLQVARLDLSSFIIDLSLLVPWFLMFCCGGQTAACR